MDWNDTGYSYIVEVNVVSQTNVDLVIGSLHGVKLEGMVISENYYSDSRIQAKLKTVVDEGESDGYVNYGRLRIILTIPEREWSEELITGYVSNISEDSQHGYTQREYTIEGTIWGLLDHKINATVSISSGAGMVNIWKDLMANQTKMQYSTTNAKDHSFNSTKVYEAGTSLSTLLFEICSGYSRMDTNGHGVVVLDKYTAPKNRTPSRVIDFTNPRGLSLYPLTSSNSNMSEQPGRAIVTASVSESNGDGAASQKILVGCYDAPASDPTSIANRGWLKARLDSYSGSSENPTKAELDAEAENNWKNNQDGTKEWNMSTVFADYHEGEVVTLIPPSSYSEGKSTGIKVLVSGVRTNLEDFTQELTLKEV